MQRAQVLDRRADRPVGALQHLAAATQLGQADKQVARGRGDLEPLDARLEADEVTPRERLQQGPALLERDLELGEQRAVERPVADAEAVAAQTGLAQPLEGERDHLRVAGRRGHADQLESTL